jgi:UDP-4-amino-4,6-dideoxy-N-acetyl-beta-L-altrosamine N-acetyltransferase
MIIGEKVTLRALEDKDKEVLRGWRNHPELLKYQCSSFPISEAEQNRWYDSYAANGSYHIFIIEDEARDSIGYTITKNIDHKNRCAEIGIYLDPKTQGQGYGKDAFQALMKYCFYELNLHRLYLVVFAFNTRAIDLYKKLGWQIEGTWREASFKNNQYCDIVQMSILDSEFRD